MANTASEVYMLPAVAVSTLADEGLILELHCIGISHYCTRAAWALQISGLPYKKINYLPVYHVFGIKRLQARFKQGPGAATASSPSPFATPVLAIYSAKKQPLCLISNSALISRYAALRAQALQLPNSNQLYGDSLTLEPTSSSSSSSDYAITASGTGSQTYSSVSELELRLSGTMGIEVRRIMYYHLLPSPKLAGVMFYRNSSSISERLLSPLLYLVGSVLLPKAMKINAKTAARGKQLLREEFDFFDQALAAASKQQEQGRVDKENTPAAAAAAASVCANGGSSISAKPGKLPYYLCGSEPSAADISLAGLAGYIVGVPAKEMGVQFAFGMDALPHELNTFMQELRDRPTGKFVLEMWRVHGPLQHQSRTPCKL